MLHVIEDEFGAGLAADRRIARREELERHRSERAATGREPGFYWIWTQRNFPRGVLSRRLMQRYRKAAVPINPLLRKPRTSAFDPKTTQPRLDARQGRADIGPGMRRLLTP